VAFHLSLRDPSIFVAVEVTTVFPRLVSYAEEISKALRIEFLNGDVDRIQF